MGPALIGTSCGSSQIPAVVAIGFVIAVVAIVIVVIVVVVIFYFQSEIVVGYLPMVLDFVVGRESTQPSIVDVLPTYIFGKSIENEIFVVKRDFIPKERMEMEREM